MRAMELHRYARMNQIDELRAAIMAGMNLNEKDEFGATPLQYAIAENNVDVISLLLEHDADITAQDADGKTALHYAIEHKLPRVAEELIKKNPKAVAIADKFGNEPLWTATFNANGNYELVTLLLRYGADPDHLNNANLSPRDIPKRKHDDELVQILDVKRA
jgi:uncharacterized protein